MSKIKDYKILNNVSPWSLSDIVNTQITLGYKPVGGVIVDTGGYFYQAMIKEEE
jgi:hypothetical protein